MSTTGRFLLAALIGLMLPKVCRGDVIARVHLDTAPLVGHAAGPFSVNFQLTDGSGAGDANNQAVLSGFDFGGGSALPGVVLQGGASGSLGTSILMADTSFFNDFVQPFQAGVRLSFDLRLTTNVDAGPTPDQFSFTILDRTGVQLPTPSWFGALLYVDIDSRSPILQIFPTNPFMPPDGGGQPISMPAPEVVLAIPEPATALLTGLALAAGLLLRRERHGH